MRHSIITAAVASFAIIGLAQAGRLQFRREIDLHLQARNSCDILECGKALAPTVEECAYVGTKFYDAPADMECIQAAIELGSNLPDVCKDCPAKYNIKLP
ncbi:hypothetical protein GYMLUDRAFT_49238 [Collybiopsis luxurians FD-317 M1]|uniref:Unplaced genomic scaffold GYMLUscaffold_77, whole genome shotgun sequence n=1 Tax=Collybiopsis luxurians FD-317 M1 TaxID=944289 RepID=A0A0D0BG88_9AGAR|nr:hypothetical protein GYMLUDRAFT_49238 [Collybiopsis luxurians FD-317 M1]